MRKANNTTFADDTLPDDIIECLRSFREMVLFPEKFGQSEGDRYKAYLSDYVQSSQFEDPHQARIDEHMRVLQGRVYFDLGYTIKQIAPHPAHVIVEIPTTALAWMYCPWEPIAGVEMQVVEYITRKESM